MRVSKEKAIATFTYPYQSYGISFALDEINYEELYEAFVRFCTRFDGFARSALWVNSDFGSFTKDKLLVRSQIDLVFDKVLALDTDTDGFYEYGMIEAEKSVIVEVSFSKLSDSAMRVTKPNSSTAPLIFFEFELSFLGKKRPESHFIMTVTKEKDLKVGLPDWK